MHNKPPPKAIKLFSITAKFVKPDNSNGIPENKIAPILIIAANNNVASTNKKQTKSITATMIKGSAIGKAHKPKKIAITLGLSIKVCKLF